MRPNGRVSIVSLLGRGEPPLDFNPLAMEWFYAKGISLIAVHGEDAQLYPHADASGHLGHCDHVLSLMAEKKLQPSRLITHRLHYTEMVQAYEMAYAREKSMLGVIFNWRE